MTDKACSAYRVGGICANGFPQNASCYGRTCHGCGRYSDKTPACMNEDLHARWFDDAGLPRFAEYRLAKTETPTP